MSSLQENPSARLYSALFPEHLALLRANTFTRELVFGAFDQACAVVSEDLLKNLEGTLLAGCMNPKVMLRPQTETDLNPAAMSATPKIQRSGASRSRVTNEIRRRVGPSGDLPKDLRDRTFVAKEAAVALPFVELDLRKAFDVLAGVLANQAFAFSDTTLCQLSRRQIDEAMNSMQFSPEQQEALSSRHEEMRATVNKVSTRLEAIRRCKDALGGQTRTTKSARKA